MKDMIIKGTGDSRYLKSVSNFLSLYPDYESFVAALVAGTLPIDLNGINSAGVTQEGTPLTKANLLSDTAAKLMGATGTDPTIDAAFRGASFPVSVISASTVTISTDHVHHFLYLSHATSCTITVPASSAIPAGSEIYLCKVTPTVTVTAGSGITIHATGKTDASSYTLAAPYFAPVILKKINSTVWVLMGDMA